MILGMDIVEDDESEYEWEMVQFWWHDALCSIHVCFGKTKSFIASHSKWKLNYIVERLRADVHEDFKCRAFCLSELGNKYRSQENGNENIIEFKNYNLGARELSFGS